MREDDHQETDLHNLAMRLMGDANPFTGMKVIPNPYLGDYEVVVMVGKKYYESIKASADQGKSQGTDT